MSKTLLLLLGLVSIATATTNFPLQDNSSDWSPNGINITEFRYYYTAARAMLDGFQKGLYNNNSLSLKSTCMDETSLQSIITLEDLLSAGDIGGLFKSSSAFFNLAYSFDKACDLNEMIYQSVQWAYQNGTTLDQIQANFQSNLFTLTGALNEVFSVFFGNNNGVLDWTDLTGCKAKYLTLG